MANVQNSNLAYDIAKFEEHEPRRKSKNNIESKIVENKVARDFASHFMLVLVFAVVAFCVISTKAEIAQVHNDVTEAKSTVQTLQSENASLKASLETKSSIKSVEDYAENVLGMQKLDKSQIEYVSLENGNVAEIPEQDDDVFTKIADFFDNIWAYLKGET